MIKNSELHVRRIASHRHGVVTRREALAAGMSARTIDERIASGAWARVKLGVYYLGLVHNPASILAAATAYLPAVVSHESASELHRLGIGSGDRTIVTVPHRATNRFLDVVVHESTDLAAAHVTEVDGLPVTTVARTIVDLASIVGRDRLRRAIDVSVVDRATSIDEITEVFAAVARRGKPGVRRMREVLEDLAAGQTPSESELEWRFMRLIARSALPEPAAQYPLPWSAHQTGRVDFAYPDEKLIVECDGRRWHATAQAFASDRRRDNLAQLAGWRVLRFTWEDVVRRPANVVAAVGAALNGDGDGTTRLAG